MKSILLLFLVAKSVCDGIELTGVIKKFELKSSSQDLLTKDDIIIDMREERQLFNESPIPISKQISYSRKFKEISELMFTKPSQDFLEVCETVTTGPSVSIGRLLGVRQGFGQEWTTNKKTAIVDSHRTQKVFREQEVIFEDKTAFTIMPFQKLRIESFVEAVKDMERPYTAIVQVTGSKSNGDKATTREIRYAVKRRNSNALEVTANEDSIEYEIEGSIIASFGLKAKTVMTDISDTSSTTISTTVMELTRTDFTITTVTKSEEPGRDGTRIDPGTQLGLSSISAMQSIVIVLIVGIVLYLIVKVIVKYRFRERTESISCDISIQMSEGLD